MRLSPAPSLFKNKRKDLPEQAELRRKTGQRGLLIASYKRLKKRLRYGHNSCGRGRLCRYKLGTTRVPASQAAAPPSRSTLTGAELPQAKKKKTIFCLYMQSCFSCVQLFVTMWTEACQASLSGRGFSRQEYWSALANSGSHTLLEHYIS